MTPVDPSSEDRLQNDAACETYQRLLDAAGEVFAEKGFQNATVRDICQRAGANVAAINYHFGDKEKLYGEVLRYAHSCAMQKHPPEMGVPANSPPQDRLRAFVVSFLHRLFDKGRPTWHAQLITREISQPTAALARLVKQDLQPRRDQLTGVLREIIGPGADELVLRHCVMSIVGQCLAFYHGRTMLENLYPEQRFDAAAVEERAEFIYRFSLGALAAMSRSSADAKSKKSKSKPDAGRKRVS